MLRVLESPPLGPELLPSVRRVLRHVGVGFAAAEQSSGRSYPKVGFLQFTDRAAAIAESIASG